jgi:uracil-DNA glycosylase
MSNLKRKATSLDVSGPKKPKPTIDGSITSFFGAPKSSPPAVKFNKAKWVETLTPEQRDLLKLEIETLHESWLLHLKEEVVSSEFLELKRFLKREKEGGKTIFPPEEDIYSWWVVFSPLFCLGKSPSWSTKRFTHDISLSIASMGSANHTYIFIGPVTPLSTL